MFRLSLEQAGFCLKTSGTNEIKADEAEFIQRLEKDLKDDLDYPDNLGTFMRGLEEFLQNETALSTALAPTQIHPDALESARKNIANSLIRILLQVLDLQPLVIDYLLDQVEKRTTTSRLTAESRKIPVCMLSCMLYLPRIAKPKPLTEKLKRLISAVPSDFKAEMITVLPALCSESQHADIAIFLSGLFNKDSKLTASILGALTELFVPPEEISTVRDNVMKRLSSMQTEDLPNALRFVLENLPDSEAKNIVIQLRDVLNDKFAEKINLNESLMPSTLSRTQVSQPGKGKGPGKADESLESITLDVLSSCLGKRVNVIKIWLKVIKAAGETSDLTSFDLLLLITFYSFFHSKKTVGTALRNQIRLNLITPKLVFATFQNHSAAIQGDSITSCLELGDKFLISPDSQVAVVGSAVMKSMFSVDDSYITQEVMYSLGKALAQKDCSEHPIQLLNSLVNDHPKKVLKYSAYLSSLLTSIDLQNLLKVRKIMDVIAQLAFVHGDDNSQLSNDIFIFIRKHLSQDVLRLKKVGVVTAVMAARSLAYVSSANDTGSDLSTTSSIVTPGVKRAIDLLEQVKSSVQKSTEAEGLFLDELSNLVLHSVVSSKILEWIRLNVHDEFLSRFIKDLEGDFHELNDIVPLKLQYALETSEIGISLGPLVCQAAKSTNDSILIVPFFRLMRLVDFHLSGNLESIDALLSCGIYLPSDDAIENFSTATTKEKNIILNCLFLCLNLFREVINAFGPVKRPEYYFLVLKRISQAVEIEQTLAKLLNIHSSFIPPRSQYWVDIQLTVPSTGRKRTKTIDGGGTKKRKTQDGAAETQAEKKSKTEAKKDAKVAFSHYREFIRELDIDTLQLFRRGFELDEKAIKREEIPKLGPKELLWLTDEMLPKFQHVFSTKKCAFGQKKSTGQFILIDQFEPKFIAKQVVKATGPISACLETASQYFQSLSAANGDESILYSDDSPIIGSCFNNCLNIIAIIFAWNGLTDKESHLLAKELLYYTAKRIDQTLAQKTKTIELANLAARYYSNYTPTLPYINCAAAQCKILASIGKLVPLSDSKTSIMDVIPQHLKREWRGVDGCRDHGAAFNRSLEYLLDESVKFVKEPFKYLDETVHGPLKEVLEANGKSATATDLPTLSKQSFLVYYRCLFRFLTSSLKEFTGRAEQPSEDEQFRIWMKAIELLGFFVSVTKTFGQKPYLLVCLKNSRLFLEFFLKHGMSLIDSVFRHKREESIILLKSVQASSRQMHHICSHARVIKDVTLCSLVPALKKNLEAFVYRVKAMLALNKCTDAFWMGNLKNRTLKGMELPSQVESEDEGEDEEEVEEAVDVTTDAEVSEDDLDAQGPSNGKGRSMSPFY